MIFHKENFRRIREARGLTFDDIAAACGVTKQTAQKWAKHQYLKPRPDKIPKLAAILRCPESEIASYGDAPAKAVPDPATFDRAALYLRRTNAGLTMLQLAKAVGVAESTVCGWENGTNTPRPSKIPRIAAALGCAVRDLAPHREPRPETLPELLRGAADDLRTLSAKLARIAEALAELQP